MFGASFDSTKKRLQDLLRDVHTGKMQLPEFQRSWIWDDHRIRSLLASIAVSFPIGAIMTLETGGEANFKARMIEGAENGASEPNALLLDGQQRLTSLYQALITRSPVRTTDTRGKKIQRHYYVDMTRALADDADRDGWIISMPEDRQMKTFRQVVLDLSTPDREYEERMFPLDRVFSSADWRHGFNQHWQYDREEITLFDRFEAFVIKRFEQYDVPVIELSNGTSKEAACLVFEKVNTGGVTLNVFELVTASFAADDFSLRQDWDTRRQQMLRLEQHQTLQRVQGDQFLQAVTLLATLAKRVDRAKSGASFENLPAIGCRRREILKLSLSQYKEWADRAQEGFIKAARFLRRQHVFRAKDVPYQTQIVPLAAILAALGHKGTGDAVQMKIARWFWCGVFGEMYGSSVETIFARDLGEMVEWVKGGSEIPSTIRDANFAANRLLTLRTRNSAAYKGIYARLMREGSRDFLSGEPLMYQVFDEASIDIHHVFPQDWCERQNPPIGKEQYNSIINKAPISARVNRRIGSKSPSKYLRLLENEIEPTRLQGVLLSHRIDPTPLYEDDFWSFYQNRAISLVKLVSSAMGKEIAMDDVDFGADAEIEEFEDRPEEFFLPPPT